MAEAKRMVEAPTEDVLETIRKAVDFLTSGKPREAVFAYLDRIKPPPDLPALIRAWHTDRIAVNFMNLWEALRAAGGCYYFGAYWYSATANINGLNPRITVE